MIENCLILCMIFKIKIQWITNLAREPCVDHVAIV